MNALTKLTAVALSVAGIAGGVAMAQTTLDPKQPDNPATANYSISPGSNLKRDGSLSSPENAPVVTESATDTSRTWTSTTTTTSTTASAPPMDNTPVAAAPAPAADTTVADSTPAPRADRN